MKTLVWSISWENSWVRTVWVASSVLILALKILSVVFCPQKQKPSKTCQKPGKKEDLIQNYLQEFKMAISDIALIFIQIIVYFWSFITWPFYFIYYGPWKRTRNFKRKRATQIDIKTDEVTYRAKPRLSHLRTILKNHEANIRTMDKGKFLFSTWIMFEKSKFRQNEKLSVKLTCIVILSKLDFILNRKFFFQFGNMLLNNLPKNDVWELEK